MDRFCASLDLHFMSMQQRGSRSTPPHMKASLERVLSYSAEQLGPKSHVQSLISKMSGALVDLDEFCQRRDRLPPPRAERPREEVYACGSIVSCALAGIPLVSRGSAYQRLRTARFWTAGNLAAGDFEIDINQYPGVADRIGRATVASHVCIPGVEATGVISFRKELMPDRVRQILSELVRDFIELVRMESNKSTGLGYIYNHILAWIEFMQSALMAGLQRLTASDMERMFKWGFSPRIAKRLPPYMDLVLRRTYEAEDFRVLEFAAALVALRIAKENLNRGLPEKGGQREWQLDSVAEAIAAAAAIGHSMHSRGWYSFLSHISHPCMDQACVMEKENLVELWRLYIHAEVRGLY